MTTFSLRCPNTGLIVQGWIAHDPTEQADTYEPVTCTACARTFGQLGDVGGDGLVAMRCL